MTDEYKKAKVGRPTKAEALEKRRRRGGRPRGSRNHKVPEYKEISDFSTAYIKEAMRELASLMNKSESETIRKAAATELVSIGMKMLLLNEENKEKSEAGERAKALKAAIEKEQKESEESAKKPQYKSLNNVVPLK